MNEIWKPIPGYPGYEASDRGQIRSTERPLKQINRWGRAAIRIYPGRVLKLRIGKNGYAYVNLGDKARSCLAHRLVFMAFHGKIPAGKEVNHINFDRQKNEPANLNALTPNQNKAYTAKAGRKRSKSAHLSDLDISVIRKSVRSYEVLARLFRTTTGAIGGIRNSKRSFKYVGAYEL
jgi:hypothetical protein